MREGRKDGKWKGEREIEGNEGGKIDGKRKGGKDDVKGRREGK